MPLFEYSCRGCGRQFEAFVTADRAAACPACEGTDLQKLLSSPGMVGTSGRKENAAIPSCRAQGGHCGCSHNSSLN
jgi:putative FmdB family regulatory protein